jgi:hypothetical protein
MAQVKFEVPFANDNEVKFAQVIEAIVDGFRKAEDCRIMAEPLRKLAPECNVRMVIGCGGSHIYIHREHEFIKGENTHAQNIRWAIITD